MVLTVAKGKDCRVKRALCSPFMSDHIIGVQLGPKVSFLKINLIASIFRLLFYYWLGLVFHRISGITPIVTITISFLNDFVSSTVFLFTMKLYSTLFKKIVDSNFLYEM
jgi:hypothetical protein